MNRFRIGEKYLQKVILVCTIALPIVLRKETPDIPDPTTPATTTSISSTTTIVSTISTSTAPHKQEKAVLILSTKSGTNMPMIVDLTG